MVPDADAQERQDLAKESMQHCRRWELDCRIGYVGGPAVSVGVDGRQGAGEESGIGGMHIFTRSMTGMEGWKPGLAFTFGEGRKEMMKTVGMPE